MQNLPDEIQAAVDVLADYGARNQTRYEEGDVTSIVRLRAWIAGAIQAQFEDPDYESAEDTEFFDLSGDTEYSVALVLESAAADSALVEITSELGRTTHGQVVGLTSEVLRLELADGEVRDFKVRRISQVEVIDA